MSITYTYTTLTEAIKSYAEDTDEDFVANIDDFIGKAETRILRDLDLETFEAWQIVTVSSGNRQVAKPTNAIEINSMFIRNPAVKRWIELPRRSFEYAMLFAPVEASVGVPQFYCEFGQDNIWVVPTPDQSYSGGNASVRATIRPTGLSSTNATSWLGNNVADLLFHACMIEAHNFSKNPAKIEEAAGMYQSLIQQIGFEMEQIRRPTYKRLNAEQQQKGADD